MAETRRRGTAAAVVCSQAFVALARNQARVFGVADLPLVAIRHPLGGLAFPEVRERAASALPQLVQLLGAT